MNPILSIDVEEWFHILESKNAPCFNEWNDCPSRVDKIVPKLLNILALNNTKATFFFLGWVAEKYPGLVKLVYEQGHEIGTHGYAHQLIYHQTPEEFYQDVKKAKEILEDITGKKVVGYRAPGFSITPSTQWAYKILMDLEIKYSSSAFPARRAHGEFREFELVPVKIENNGRYIVEFPLTVINLFGIPLSCFGGGYFRLFPYCFFKAAKGIILKNKRPLIVYLHPREIDMEQPRLGLPMIRRFKYYVNLSTTEKKLNKMISEDNYMSFIEAYENYIRENNLIYKELIIEKDLSSAYITL